MHLLRSMSDHWERMGLGRQLKAKECGIGSSSCQGSPWKHHDAMHQLGYWQEADGGLTSLHPWEFSGGTLEVREPTQRGEAPRTSKRVGRNTPEPRRQAEGWLELEPERFGALTERLPNKSCAIGKKAVKPSPSDGVRVCMHACVCVCTSTNTLTPDSSHPPVSCWDPKPKWKLKRQVAWVMGSAEASLLGVELVRGQRGIRD